MKPTEKGTSKKDAIARAQRVRLLLMDCDGVMTDGRLYFSGSGEDLKVFHVHDGQGIATWHSHGFQSGIISGRGAHSILRARADELGMRFVRTHSKDKVQDLASILEESATTLEETAFIGDDLGDIPALDAVGFPVAVANAVGALDAHVLYRTDRAGGAGAIRELIDFLLIAKQLGK